MSKEVQKNNHIPYLNKRVKNLKLIYDFIRKYNKLPAPNYINLKKLSGLNYYVSKLLSLKFIKKVGYGTYEIDKVFDPKQLQKKQVHTPPAHLNTVNFLNFSQDTIRGHAFIFRFRLPKKFRNWEKRVEYVKEYKKELSPYDLNKGLGIIYKGRKIHLWNKSIVVYENMSYYSEIAKNTENEAILKVLKLVKGLGREIKADFSILKMTVNRKHFGMVKNALAEYYKRHNQKEYINDKYGYWLTIDFSRLMKTSPIKEAELETWSNQGHDATETADKLKDWWNEQKETNFEVGPKFVLKMFHNILEDRLYHAENIKAHVKAIQKMGDMMEKIFDRLK